VRVDTAALAVFASPRKIDAILEIVAHVHARGFRQVKTDISVKGVDYLRQLPFMGPATSFHLAKNLGLDVVKPDRHLVRIAEATGHSTPDELCQEIAREVGDRVAVVDLVLWRYANLRSDYLACFHDAKRPEPISDRLRV